MLICEREGVREMRFEVAEKAEKKQMVIWHNPFLGCWQLIRASATNPQKGRVIRTLLPESVRAYQNRGMLQHVGLSDSYYVNTAQRRSHP